MVVGRRPQGDVPEETGAATLNPSAKKSRLERATSTGQHQRHSGQAATAAPIRDPS